MGVGDSLKPRSSTVDNIGYMIGTYAQKYKDNYDSFANSVTASSTPVKTDPFKAIEFMHVYNVDFRSGTDVRLVINNVYIDDLSGIMYNFMQEKTPIYGYRSEYYDTVSFGRVLVEGSFTVNFRFKNYIPYILSQTLVNEDSHIEGGDAVVESLKSAFWGDELNTDAGSLPNDGSYGTQELKDIFKVPFDIQITYGDENITGSQTSETLKSVNIISMGKVIEANGIPIQEEYKFIAQKIE